MPFPVNCIRNAARAVIIRQEQVLLLRKEGGGLPVRYALPGGAQELGETLEQSLQRECREEIGSEVAIRSLVHVADYFKQRKTEPPSIRQLLEFLFLCELPESYVAGNGPRPDKSQVAVEWIPLQAFGGITLLPNSMAGVLAKIEISGSPTYLGTID